jgi:hypothetical protein
MGFGIRVPVRPGQPALRAAIRMRDQDHTPGRVQPPGKTERIDNHGRLVLVVWRGDGLGAAGKADRLDAADAAPLQKRLDRQRKAVVEARYDGRIRPI